MSIAPAEVAESLVLSRLEGGLLHLTLNRPRAINALNALMFQSLLDEMTSAETRGARAILLDGAGERGFCGGGDIKELSAGNAAVGLELEYRLNLAIAHAPVPVITLMDGVTMGGGIGLGAHASHRVVTERSRLAMPEARIGLVPDVGGHRLLARMPHSLGEYFATTAREMTGADAVMFGFADWWLPSDRLSEVRGVILQALDDQTSITAAVSALAQPVQEAPAADLAGWWEPAVDTAKLGEHPREGALRLLDALESSEVPEAQAAAETIREMCPLSVVATIAALDRVRRHNLSLAEVLDDDLRVAGRLAALPNFHEGVRAQVIDKDRDPHWQPASIEALTEADLAPIFDARRDDEVQPGW